MFVYKQFWDTQELIGNKVMNLIEVCYCICE